MYRPNAIIALLLAGIAINIGMSWSLAMLVRPTSWERASVAFSQTSLSAEFLHAGWRKPGAMRIASTPADKHNPSFDGIGSRYITALIVNSIRPHFDEQATSDLPSWSRITMPVTASRNGAMIEDARGWPLLSMRCAFHLDAAGGVVADDRLGCIVMSDTGLPGRQFGVALGGITEDDWSNPRVLPLNIIPLGFLVNSLLYAVLLATCCGAAIQARRTVRRRLGRCVRCGYDVRAAVARCPECGTSK